MNKVKLLFEIPYFQVKKNKNNTSFYTKYNGVWKKKLTSQLISDVNNLSKKLLQLGLVKNDKVAIITDRNRAEWHIVDYALMQIGVLSVPIHSSTSIIETKYILNHCQAKFCFVSNKEMFDKVVPIRSNVNALIDIFTFDAIAKYQSVYDLITSGKLLNTIEQVEIVKKTILEDDIMTIIYTSGTTAMPKGVMISHKNVVSTIYKAYDETVPKDVHLERALSFLPISHLFERMILYMYQNNEINIYFAESLESIGQDMKTVKPQVLIIVPRLLEKIHDKIVEKANELSFVKKKLFKWAMEIGYNYLPDEQNGPKYERKLALARKTVFIKWKEVFGGEVELIICGGSKLQPKLSSVFNAAGLYVMDGYGLTESSAVLTVNSRLKGCNKIGSVGRPISSLEVVIANDNEILIKGDNVMKGYYKNDFKTNESFENGYFKTGDLGKLDKDGFLYITGRKKDIFKTSGGKYVAPSKIENQLKLSNQIEQVMVIGENERFPAAIIQPNFEFFSKKYPKFSKEEISNSKEVLVSIQREVVKCNEVLSQSEKIKKIGLTIDEWTIDRGHLTPTLKVKRDVVKSKYYDIYSEIYRPMMTD